MQLEGEKYTGFGLQFSTVDFTGMKDVPLFVAEQGVGRGEQPITGIMNKVRGGEGRRRRERRKGSTEKDSFAFSMNSSFKPPSFRAALSRSWGDDVQHLRA